MRYARVVALQAGVVAAYARVEGMRADNQGREAAGDSPAWVYKDFAEEALVLDALAQEARAIDEHGD